MRHLPAELKIQSSIPALGRGDFSWSSDTSDFKIRTAVATLPGRGLIGSVLGPVGSMSVYCDWVR